MKRLLPGSILFFLLYSITCPALGKTGQIWHSGTVVLMNGDSMHCQMRFTRRVSEGLLQIRQGDRVKVLTVKDVLSFYYNDQTRNCERMFRNISFTPVLSTRKHEVFVELTYESDNFLVFTHKTLGYSEKSIQLNPFRKKSVVSTVYLMDKRTGAVELMTREAALAMMHSRKADVENFLALTALKLKTVSDFIALIDFHDTLK